MSIEFFRKYIDILNEAEGMVATSQDSLFDAIRPTIDFAISRGYTISKGRGNSINFLYDLGTRNVPVMTAKVYADEGQVWVNFDSLMGSGNDPADAFLVTFKRNHKEVQKEIAREKQSHNEFGMK